MGTSNGGKRNVLMDQAVVAGNECHIQRLYGGEDQSCVYAPEHLGLVKLSFFIHTGCTRNLL